MKLAAGQSVSNMISSYTPTGSGDYSRHAWFFFNIMYREGYDDDSASL